MTTYYIKKIVCDIDTTKGNGSLSNPPFLKLFNASDVTCYLPGMVNTTQSCFSLMEYNSNIPILKYSYTSNDGNGTDVSVSSSGQYIIIKISGDLLLSKDYGVSFDRVVSNAKFSLGSCVISSTGQYMSTSSSVSSNYGSTWTTSNNTLNLYNMCMGSTGAIVYGRTGNDFYDGSTSGEIYKSTDYGYSYTSIATSSTLGITSLCCSSDGTKVTYTTYNGYIYVSTNSGSTFTPKGTLNCWTASCMSSNGVTQYAAKNDELSYSSTLYRSTDSGSTWSILSYESAGFITDIACSSDGTIYEYSATGLTDKISMSSDGTYRVKNKYVAGVGYDYYYSSNSGSNYSTFGIKKPTLFDILNVGGDYNISLDLKKITKYSKFNYSLYGGYSAASAVYSGTTDDSMANEMCNFFELSRSSFSNITKVNLYLAVCTINGNSDTDYRCYVPIFYFGNSVYADRTLTI